MMGLKKQILKIVTNTANTGLELVAMTAFVVPNSSFFLPMLQNGNISKDVMFMTLSGVVCQKILHCKDEDILKEFLEFFDKKPQIPEYKQETWFTPENTQKQYTQSPPDTGMAVQYIDMMNMKGKHVKKKLCF